MDGTIYEGQRPPDPVTSHILNKIVGQLDERDIPIAYISGRSMFRIEQALEKHELALPAFVGASVGSEIFARIDHEWHAIESYRRLMSTRWIGDAAAVLDALMTANDLPRWKYVKGTEFRRTYLIPNEVAIDDLRGMIGDALRRHGLDTLKAVVSGPGYEGNMHVDFLPDNGTKVHAARFIAHELLGVGDLTTILYTGDSGNDVDLLLAAGFAALVHTNESGLAEKLLTLRPEIFFSSHENVYGVRHALEHFGIIRPHAT